MPLSWNEIRSRALAFSKEWAEESSEDAEAKAFWDAFFAVFGVTRRRVASFEEPVKKSDGKGGYIDLLWRGVLIVEHKSRGKDLDRATKQAFDYFPGLKERDLPRYVVVSDFARFRLHDLDAGTEHDFDLADLHKNVKLFGFMAGYQSRSFGKEAAVNIRAAEKLGKLHDLLKASGYEGHQLEVLLVRLLFQLFAEDTAIFERRQFTDWIEQRTSDDGADLGSLLNTLFEVLDTPPEKRQKSLDEQLAGFPYVNGRLFAENLRSASFDRAMRETLLDCTALDWSQISPAIFGSLFQSIMDAQARRDLGAHYTSEHNIRKALGPLFLDDLWAELGKLKASAKSNAKRLLEFHAKLAGIRVLDPACGCGNFLVVAYQELRLIELELLREMHKHRETGFLDVGSIMFVDVDQFHGIEYEEFPAQIAQVALWLTDHQMNMRVSEEFGQYFVRLPLKKAANIVHGNALTTDWASVVKPADLSYIVGNPPFVGKKEQSPAQKSEVMATFDGLKGAGVLDYVTCWYRKATDYMTANPVIRTAFVSTNSITQGEQVGILWGDLFTSGVKIHFAHRTFQWSSEARGKAAVHCVIIGFGLQDRSDKLIFDYDTPQSEPHALAATQINGYLVDAPGVVISKRSKPLNFAAPEMAYGSMPIDNGHLTLTEDDAQQLIAAYSEATPYIRRYQGGDEFINGQVRYCLWLVGCPPENLRAWPLIRSRVEATRAFRQSSNRERTNELADTPALFGEIRQPTRRYLFVPKVSSENRHFLPIGYCEPEVISSGSGLLVGDATPYHFGVLTSTMHMAWMRTVCGRMKSDYQYSAGIVYNNFPWPTPTEPQRKAIEQAAQAVLDARAMFPNSTLADLYDPLTMPPELTAAHRKLDKAVDVAYGKPAGFPTEAERVAYLFKLYEAATA
ncbi:DNA methyltransferase [Dechloromonas sp. H13]|uniref:class I SAM-dependent DNA methyltransferase n=1 Tax=Dechloromonas sp. H13 TaxID=2570193 RepID=UPI001291D7DD|nr:DNA methyltransferase [Dechloromonas sp. H13]